MHNSRQVVGIFTRTTFCCIPFATFSQTKSIQFQALCPHVLINTPMEFETAGP